MAAFIINTGDHRTVSDFIHFLMNYNVLNQLTELHLLIEQNEV